MDNMDCELSLALSNSISGETLSSTADLLEVGLDSIMNDGLLKDIPVLSTAVSLYKIGRSLYERHYLKKLAGFVYALNQDVIDEKKREYYRKKITDNPESRNKELEHILVLIDRYIHVNKAELLATFYLSYLDGSISWLEFSKCAEIIDRLLPGDLEMLKEGAKQEINDDYVSDSLLRMEGLGLYVSHSRGVTITEIGEDGIDFPDSKVKSYELTSFGKLFADHL